MAEFAEKGFAAARLEDIAKRAGVVKGTLYLYFDSKEALFNEVVRGQVLPSIEEISAQIERFEGPSEALLTMMIQTFYTEMQRSDLSAILRIMIAEGGRFPELTRFYHREVVSKGEALLLQILTRGIARGEFRQSAIMDSHMVIFGPAISASIWQMTFDQIEPLDMEAHMRAHLDLVLNGVKNTGES